MEMSTNNNLVSIISMTHIMSKPRTVMPSSIASVRNSVTQCKGEQVCYYMLVMFSIVSLAIISVRAGNKIGPDSTTQNHSTNSILTTNESK
jgi:hypothetical protein